MDAPTLRRRANRHLPHYPDTARRMFLLGLTVLATVTLYYELYVQGAVATQIIAFYDFSFTGFVTVSVVGAAFGAFASLGAGLADRWGRANLVVGGLLLTGLLIEFGLPNASTRSEYTVCFALLSVVEGMALVATPALIRDFSPQVGRASAMAFWTMGPVLGSLMVTEVSSHTLARHPQWQYQFHLCGAIGLAVWVLALLGLRELSPRLRDQLMVSPDDRALIEARATRPAPAPLPHGHWRQMLRFDIVGSALAISLFLLLYYVFVGFLVVYFQTVFGYPAARANGLANWFWIAFAAGLLVAGLASDRLLVRKPFMVLGALISLVGVGLFATTATRPETAHGTFVLDFVLIAGGTGMAYVAWMTAFTETVERHDPAATATGLAVWGWTLRLVVTFGLLAFTAVVPSTGTLADQGARMQQIAARYPRQIQALQAAGPGAAVAPRGLPPADLAFVAANGASVARAARDNPGQWRTWWWICFAAQLAFLPCVFLVTGRWSPRGARADERAHGVVVRTELALLEPA